MSFYQFMNEADAWVEAHDIEIFLITIVLVFGVFVWNKIFSQKEGGNHAYTRSF